MSYTNTHILLSAGYGATVGIKADWSANFSRFQPPHNVTFERATSLLWAGKITAVTGSPTTFELRAYLQTAIGHTADYQWSRPEWFDVPTAYFGVVGAGVTVGTDYLTIADQTTALPKLFTFSIPELRGRPVRLRLDMPYTGATVPALTTALTLTERGN